MGLESLGERRDSGKLGQIGQSHLLTPAAMRVFAQKEKRDWDDWTCDSP